MTNIIKKVLWVENRPLKVSEYKEEARSYGLDLVAVGCWDDAKKALTDNIDKWSAIILQPKSQLHAGSYKNVKQFLPQAFTDMYVIFENKGKSLPWYILTDCDESEFKDMILESRNSFDNGWPNSYYNSNNEEERTILFNNIQAHSQLAERLQVRNGCYKPVFDALTYLENKYVHTNVRTIMEDLLISVVFGITNHVDIGKVRSVMEYIFSSMMTNGILPSDLINLQGRMNNNGCVRLFSGLEVNCGSKKYKSTRPFMFEPMAKYLNTMLQISNNDIHAAISQDSQELDRYLNYLGTDFLLHSFTLQLCDLILWYEKVLKEGERIGGIPKWWEEER